MSGEQSRRDFLKSLGGAAALGYLATRPGKVMGAIPGPSSPSLNEADYPVVTTTDNLEDITVRNVRDPRTYNTFVGLTLLGYMNDDTGAADGWDFIGSSENISSLSPGVGGNAIYTVDTLPESLAEEFFTIDYRGRNPPDYANPAGMTHTIEDQIDRYKTDLTVTYNDNGVTKTETVNVPNIVAKMIFGWDLEDPLEYVPTTFYNRNDNPTEMAAAYENLNQILTEEGLEDSIMKNRNTPLPPLPDPNPWYETRQLLIDLGVDPLVQDDLYPESIKLEMTDYTK